MGFFKIAIDAFDNFLFCVCLFSFATFSFLLTFFLTLFSSIFFLLFDCSIFPFFVGNKNYQTQNRTSCQLEIWYFHLSECQRWIQFNCMFEDETEPIIWVLTRNSRCFMGQYVMFVSLLDVHESKDTFHVSFSRTLVLNEMKWSHIPFASTEQERFRFPLTLTMKRTIVF